VRSRRDERLNRLGRNEDVNQGQEDLSRRGGGDRGGGGCSRGPAVRGRGHQPSTRVGLAQCGTTLATLWILDNGGSGNEPCDLINMGYEQAYYYTYQTNPGTPGEGYAVPFAEPYVLTVNSSGDLSLAPLKSVGGVVSTTQEWDGMSPQVQAALQQSALRAKAAEKVG
jgi:hypothetical protein